MLVVCYITRPVSWKERVETENDCNRQLFFVWQDNAFASD
jgi:hypothetical protein